MNYPNFAFKALATTWWITIYDLSNEIDVSSLSDEIEKIALTFEHNYSRFLDESYIGKLNRERKLENFPLELFQIIEFAEDVRLKSGGIFNVGVGGLLEDLGYDKNYSFEAKSTDLNQVPNLGNSVFKTLSEHQLELNQGYRIDLGGLGKGWLIDKISRHLTTLGFRYHSVNGGGDIFTSSNQGKSVEFILEHPLDLSLGIGSIFIKDQGIACSASNRRIWLDKLSGKKIHHLIDLDQKISRNDKLAVFTQAKNALLADICSTAIFVAPVDKIEEIARNFQVEFLIIWPDMNFIHSKNYQGELFGVTE